MQNSLWAWSAAVLTCIRGVLSGQLRRCCTATGLWPTTTHPEWRQTTRERERSISVKRLAAVDVKQWRLTANPKAEALWRMTETAGKKSRVQLTRHLSTFFLELLSHLYHYFKRTTSNRGTLELYQHAFCVFFFLRVIPFTCAANVRPRLHLLLLPAIMALWRGKEGRRAGWWNKDEKDADGGKESSRLHPGFIFSKTHWGPATCLSPECRSTLVSFSPLVAKQKHNFIIHPFLLFLPTFSPFLMSGTIFHFKPKPKKKKNKTKTTGVGAAFWFFGKHSSSCGWQRNTDEMVGWLLSYLRSAEIRSPTQAFRSVTKQPPSLLLKTTHALKDSITKT